MVVSMRTWHCFLGATAPGHSQDPPEEVDAELQLIDALAELEENKRPDASGKSKKNLLDLVALFLE